MIRWRRRKSGIHGVLCQDKWIEEPSTVKNEVLKFFSDRMSAFDDFVVSFDNVPFQKITEYENCMLIAPFEELEIKEIVWKCGSDKSLDRMG